MFAFNFSHRKANLPIVVFLILILFVVLFSFDKIIETAPFSGDRPASENSVSANRSDTISPIVSNIKLQPAFLATGLTLTVDDEGDTDDVLPGDGICADASNNCTLRAAIQEANAKAGTDDIVFDLRLPKTIQLDQTLSPAELSITENVNITGPGARLLTVKGNANTTSGIFDVDAAATVNLSGLSLSNSNGHGINNDGVLNISESLIADNGYGIYNSGTLNIDRVLIKGNTSGGLYLAASSIVKINNTTVTGNSSADFGAGIRSLSADVALNNVTISNNTAATSGGGFYYENANSGVKARNTIIAQNTAPAGPDIFSANSATGAKFISRGNNLIGSSAADIGFANGTNGDKVGTVAAPIDPLFKTLRNNGGPTDTLALKDGSPARDAGNACVTDRSCANDNPVNALTTDQRGAGFPRNFQGGVDIGAFESFYPTPNIASFDPDDRGTGTGAFELIINGSGFVADSIVKWNGADKSTTFVSNSALKIQVTAAEVQTSGQIPVKVVNPQPGGGDSNELNFVVADCSFSLNPMSRNLSNAAGSDSFSVTAPSGCQWMATSSDAWITIDSGANGSGDGTVNFSVASNTGPQRTGKITVNGVEFTITQSGGCTFTISPTSSDLPASGGTGTVNVTASNGACGWTATSNGAWISIDSGSSGTGSGTVNYTVAANNGVPRSGTMTIAGKTFTVNQGDGCSFTLTPTSETVPAGGATKSFTVNASSSGCQWTAASNDTWITIDSGASGTGSGTVQFTVAANSGPQRVGTITAGGKTFTVTQSGGCSFSINPTSANVSAAGGTVDVAVTASNSGCAWTAASNDSWITVSSGTTGNGNGNVRISVATNNGPQRTGTVTIAGKTLTITQDNGCTYSISPTSASVSAAAEAGSFSITASSGGCQWTAASNDAWITITAGTSGTGDGTVSFTVAANTGPARVGTITAAGKTFTVNQANGCSYTISPASSTVSAGAGSVNVNVTASNGGCQWTAASNASWLTIGSGASGSGNGTVQINIAANNGPQRSGTVTIAGKTFTVTQTTGCTYTLSPTGTSFDKNAGSGSFNITVSNQTCQWTASPNQQWISISGPASGTGNGVVSYSIQANIHPERTGAIVITGPDVVNGPSFTITQGNGCSYSLSSSSVTIPAAGAPGSFNINVGAGCQWTIGTNASWVTVTSPGNGAGGATVSFTVDANVGPPRTASVFVTGNNGQVLTFTINQDNGCSFTINPTSRDLTNPSQATGTITVTASDNRCQWTAASNDAWITITAGASGTGSGTVGYTVAANTGPARVGTITAAGKTFTVNQANGCAYTLAPTSTSITEVGGTRSFNVNASNAACPWTAASNDAWITITAGASGTGNGTVALSIASSGGAERTGTVTAAGRTFTVNQVSLTVKNVNDSGPGSLRQAVINANNIPGDDVVTFLPSLSGTTIVLTSGEITIADNGALEIRGLGTEKTAISGNSSSRIFYIDGAKVTLSNLMLRDGNGLGAQSTDSIRYGGAIYANVAALTLDKVYLQQNQIPLAPDPDKRANGGAVYYLGGAFHIVRNTTFATNQAHYGGAFYALSAAISVVNSTFANNTAEKAGGAILCIGDIKLRNATITKNKSIVTGNTGAGIMIEGGSLDLGNTIIAENEGAEITFVTGAYYSAGNNLIGDTPGDAANTQNPIMIRPTDILDRKPKLALTSWYGGETPTAALFPDSPAKDAGNNAFAEATDQRGSPRIVNNTIDIGAFEHNVLVSPVPSVLPDASLDSHYYQQLRATRSDSNDPFEPYNWYMNEGVLPPGMTLTTNGGLISGQPTQSGTYTFSVKAVTYGGMAGVNTYTLKVGCANSINSTAQTLSATGGSGSVSVSGPAGCGWTSSVSPAAASWISITNGATGSGNGTVDYSVAANAGPARTGTMTIAGNTFTVNQQSGCALTINPVSKNFAISGGADSFTVAASDGACAWTASSSSSWITLNSGAAGTGGGTVSYTVGANSGPARSGTITVGNQTFNITQDGGCSYSLSADSVNMPVGGGAGSFTVNTGAACSWSASIVGGAAAWISLGAGATGTGSGTVSFTVAANTGQARSGKIAVGGREFTINQAGAAAKTRFDVDGDGKADVSVYRPENGVWHLLQSQSGYTGVQFGNSTDKPVPGDYDGDGKTDQAVYRDGIWHVLRSAQGYTGFGFGIATDVPVPVDYDGDGKTDAAVYRDGIWHILGSSIGYTAVQFGIATDKPVPGDYDGDGKADVAVYRPENGVWHILGSNTGYSAVQFGNSTDKVVPADYDGDGKTDQAVYRDGIWHVLRSAQGYTGFGFGIATDIPVPADYDGDGKTDAAVYRDGVWFMLQTRDGFAAVSFGVATDKPIPGSFVR